MQAQSAKLKKAIVSGLSGTVAPALASHLAARGHVISAWDRTKLPTDDIAAAAEFFEATKPDWFFHLATGSPAWAESVADLCAQFSVKLVFTSSVSVFSWSRPGPFSPELIPDATEDYGRYKIECEERIRAANPDALIARLGWQIGDAVGSNNMVDFIAQEIQKHGEIRASDQWLPSCSFLDDTAEALVTLMENYAPGTYHIEANPGLSFFTIAQRLNRLHGSSWKIVQTDTPQQDGRLSETRIVLRPITARLGVD
jgi:dTDP-4-dehydrorhamnose reductase